MTNLFYRVPGRVFLLLVILLAYLPFLNLRVLRMAGDEKVYISQSIEMARNGVWFAQSLADEPNYFKGPLHYVMVRIGLAIFGNNIFAAMWMNLLFALIAGFAMYRLGSRRWSEKSGILIGAATALNVGIYAHAFASQMEVELVAAYAVAVAILGLSPTTAGKKQLKWDFAFWALAGGAAWIKSPIHSVLLGTGAIFYWLLSNQLIARLKNPMSWLAVAVGAGVALLGYAPIFLFDRQNFVDTYLNRENFQKPNNNRPWDYVVTPLLHFVLPWTAAIILAFGRFVQNWKKPKTMDARMVELGIGMALPTIIFWALFRYKGQNYNMPTSPALFLFAWAVFNGEIPRLAWRLVAIAGFITSLILLAVVIQFSPLPDWWSRLWLVISFASLGYFIWIFFLSEDVRALASGALAFFVAFGALITPLGQREMRDLEQFVRQNPSAKYYYYNLDQSIWCEWGLLQLAVHTPMQGFHRTGQWPDILKAGNVVLVQNPAQLKTVTDQVKTVPGLQVEVKPWTRWLTKGVTPEGQSRWAAAWQAHDLAQLEREFYIVRLF